MINMCTKSKRGHKIKRMKYKIIKFKLSGLLCFVLLSHGIQSQAQEKWSLESCVNYALDNNIQIKQQALNVNFSENELNQAKYDRLPNLNAQIGHQFQFGRSLNQENLWRNANSQNTDFGIRSEVTLFKGMSQLNTIKQRNFEWQASVKDLEKAKDDIVLAVASAYLEILFNEELVATSKEQILITQQQIEYNSKQVEAGNMAKGGLIETQAQKANEELSLTNYENQLQLSLLNLMQLLEIPVSDSFAIQIPEFDAEVLSADLLTSGAVFNKAVAERPEILSKELMLKSMERQSEIVKSQKIPSLNLGASYGANYNNQYLRAVDPDNPALGTENIPFGDQINNQRQTLVYLSLNIPIFNKFSVNTQIENAQLQYLGTQYDLQLAKNNLLKEIQQVHANATAAMKKYYSSEKAVKSTEEAFRYVEEKFNLGIVTPLEYNDSKNKVTNAQSSFIQAKYEYIFRIKILDFYNGIEITL